MRLTVSDSNLQLQLPVDNVISSYKARVFDTTRIVGEQCCLYRNTNTFRFRQDQINAFFVLSPHSYTSEKANMKAPFRSYT